MITKAMADSGPSTVLVTGAGGRTGTPSLSLPPYFLLIVESEVLLGVGFTCLYGFGLNFGWFIVCLYWIIGLSES